MVGRALAEDPDDRYATCLDFVAALRSALVAPTSVTRPPPVLVRRRHRHRLPLTIAALLLGLIAFLLTAALSNGNAGSPPATVVQTVTVPGRTTTPASSAASAQPVAAQSQPARGNGKHKGKKEKKHTH